MFLTAFRNGYGARSRLLQAKLFPDAAIRADDRLNRRDFGLVG
jgi:hypothetical protein